MKHCTFVLTLLLGLLTFVLLPSISEAKESIKIGVTLPLTGDNAHLGESVQDALIQAQEEINPNSPYEYEIIFEDDGFEAKRAAAAANKLINIDKVDAIISLGSAMGGTVSPIAQRSKTLHFCIGASARSVADGEYNFLHWTMPEEESRVMASELKEKNVKKFALISLNQQGILALRESLKKELEGTDIEIVLDEVVNPGEKDFRSLIAKAKAQNPDMYMLEALSPEGEIITKQMREAGITKPITSVETFGLSATPSLYEGLWYVDAAIAKEDFHKKFEERFGKPAGFATANANDVINLIVYGFDHSPTEEAKPSAQSVIKTLHEITDLEGMFGPLSIDEDGIVFSPASIHMIKDGKPVGVKNIVDTGIAE